MLSPFERALRLARARRRSTSTRCAPRRGCSKARHDFAAFQGAGSDVATTSDDRIADCGSRSRDRRSPHVESAIRTPHAAMLTYEVTGNGFLRHMVRDDRRHAGRGRPRPAAGGVDRATCSRRATARRPARRRRRTGCFWCASTTRRACGRVLKPGYHERGVTCRLSSSWPWIPPGSPDETLARQVNFEQLPAHVAIIMDGNGRWAAQRHLPRVEGHRAGIDSVRDVVETSARLGIDVLTLYAFSVENWKRPRAEVNTLMMLLKRYLRLELGTLLKNNIRFRVIGRPEELAPDVQHELEIGIQQTAANTGMLFNIALNYGGRAEIVDAARRAIAAGVAPDDLDERRFGEFLYTAGQPDPDLLIRTSGEMRVSNFLLWQIAYAEIWVTETLWPDFRRRAPARGGPRLPEARSPLRRHQAVAGGARRQVTRVLSGAVARRRSPSPSSGSRRRVAVPDRRRGRCSVLAFVEYCWSLARAPAAVPARRSLARPR